MFVYQPSCWTPSYLNNPTLGTVEQNSRRINNNLISTINIYKHGKLQGNYNAAGYAQKQFLKSVAVAIPLLYFSSLAFMQRRLWI